MITYIQVPRLNANEDEYLLTAVHVSEGQSVRKGDDLFEIESTKAVHIIQADRSGCVGEITKAVGTMVVVGAPLCSLGDTVQEVSPASAISTVERSASGQEPARLTAKQRLEKLKRSDAEGQDDVILDGGQADWPESGELVWVREARAVLRQMEEFSGDSSSEVTTLWGGKRPVDAKRVRLMEGAIIEDGATVTGRVVYLGNGARICAGARILADVAYIGAGARVGASSRIVTGELVLGEGCVVGEEVLVDLSGGRSHDSRLLVGPGCLIAARALVNTCREVVLDEESALSPGVMLFTHSFWQSVLEGYSTRFKPVRVGAHAWIGAGCQVLPGVRIGAGAIVMSNSTVVEDVPAATLVGGVPARIMRRGLSRRIDSGERAQILVRHLERLWDTLKSKGVSVEEVTPETCWRLTMPSGNQRRIILIRDEGDQREIQAGDILLSLAAFQTPVAGAIVFDLTHAKAEGEEDRLSNEVRNFLRRIGIRLRPFCWDSSYQKGLQ